MDESLAQELERIKDAGLYRRPPVVASSPAKDIRIRDKSYVNFSSNNYLALATHPAVVEAAAAAVRKYGAGGTSSRLIGGSLELHRELEARLAALKRTEAALVFPSGYQTNVGVVGALAGAGDCLIMDRLNHASLWDAARIARARVFVYPHRDTEALEKVLQRARAYRRKIVITDSVFSMDGDLAPLPGIVSLAKKYGAWTMIDEAHATGVIGDGGRGLAEHYGMEGAVDIVMGTLSKALGSQGGFVCGSAKLVDYLVNTCRSFIYTTALAPACAAAALAALSVAEHEPERRLALRARSAAFRQRLTALGFDTLGSQSQIVPLKVGPVTETVSLAAKLWRDGIFAPAIRPPTVPEGECRLRFSLTSDHAADDLDRLFRSLIE